MMPLIVLLLSYVLFLVISHFYPKLSRNLAGRSAFSLMFLFTGVSHFTFTKGMIMSMPYVVPFKELLVYFTGLVELLFAVLFLINRDSSLTAKLIIALLVAIFPANIWAAIYHVDIPSASYNGPGLAYLWFRVPLQMLFISWVYYFGVKPAKSFTQKVKRSTSTSRQYHTV